MSQDLTPDERAATAPAEPSLREQRAAIDAIFRREPDETAESFRRAVFPVIAAGPLVAGPFGLDFPDTIRTLDDAQAIYAQLISTAALRELGPREKRVLQALRVVPGVRTPSAPHEFTAIAKNRLRQKSKAAKRARQVQKMAERAQRETPAAPEEVAC